MYIQLSAVNVLPVDWITQYAIKAVTSILIAFKLDLYVACKRQIDIVIDFEQQVANYTEFSTNLIRFFCNRVGFLISKNKWDTI